jgi:hypothetical protein
VIPKLNQSGVLPPFIPEQGPTSSASMAPYLSTISEFIKRYSHSPERITILKGLLEYRKKLRESGIVQGFQWLDGSFVEDVESNRGRPPADVDLVTFAFRPEITTEEWKTLVRNRDELFNPEASKDKFYCDAYYVDLDTNPINIVNQTRFWFGLFSHQKKSLLWKGMVQVSIQCSDDEASKFLEEISNA